MGITQIISHCLHALFCDVYTFSCLCMLYISFSSTCVLFEGMTRELLAHPLTKDNRLESKSSLASFCQVMVGYCCNHSAKNETVALKQTYFSWLNCCLTKRCRWHDQMHILEQCYVTSMMQVHNVHADVAQPSMAETDYIWKHAPRMRAA